MTRSIAVLYQTKCSSFACTEAFIEFIQEVFSNCSLKEVLDFGWGNPPQLGTELTQNDKARDLKNGSCSLGGDVCSDVSSGDPEPSVLSELRYSKRAFGDFAIGDLGTGRTASDEYSWGSDLSGGFPET